MIDADAKCFSAAAACCFFVSFLDPFDAAALVAAAADLDPPEEEVPARGEEQLGEITRSPSGVKR